MVTTVGRDPTMGGRAMVMAMSRRDTTVMGGRKKPSSGKKKPDGIEDAGVLKQLMLELGQL